MPPIPYDRNASLVSHHPAISGRAPGGGPGGMQDGQRARILEAMVQVVASRGYPRTTVADVVRAAGVSRSTFYALVGGKEDCFLEAHRLGTAVLEERIDLAMLAAAKEGWRGRLQDGISAYLQTLEDDRVFAHTFLVEIHQGSPATALARDEVLDRFAARFAASHEAAKRAGEAEGDPPLDVFAILAHGIDALVARALRTGEPAELADLEPVILDAALRVIRGA
ncbi:MAG: TetR/AcrR family transcriptional regulator [Solirubrobacterales bacterium]|nr:TetR/AcrR family transcriptional regulator [Solirubrobacterales bacterium]